MEKDRTDPWKLHLLELDKRFTPCDLDWNRCLLYKQQEEANKGVSRRQLIVPQALVLDVVRALHNPLRGGHLRTDKTLAKVVTTFTGLSY